MSKFLISRDVSVCKETTKQGSSLNIYLRNKGSVSIEAAVVMPFILLVFAVLLYMSHILYVENLIRSNMVLTTHELAVSATVLDELSLVDDLQEKYQAGDEIIGQSWEKYSKVSTVVSGSGDRLDDVFSAKDEIFAEISSLDRKSNIREVAESGIRIIDEFLKVKTEIQGDVAVFLDGIKFFLHNGKSMVLDGGFAAGVCFLDELMLKNYALVKFHSLISDENLRQLKVSNFKIITGRYMIPDDSVELSYSYDVYIPFITDFFDEKHEIRGQVLARAYTGSYDSKDVKSKKKSDGKSYVYVAGASSFNRCYHVYSCLRKPLESASSFSSLGRTECKYCKEHYTRGFKVYFVSGKSKLHFDKKCPRIYSRNVKKLTIDEAKKLGYRACMKKGCTGGK